MRFKLDEDICYFAGLACKSREPERSRVGIRTSNDEIAERFVKDAIRLGVDTKKIIVEEKDATKHIYFYHSKLARMIREIMERRQMLPKKSRMFAAAFVAGNFDANGHVIGGRVTMNRLDRADELMLELLGVHTVNSRILNIRAFLELIKSKSALASGVRI